MSRITNKREAKVARIWGCILMSLRQFIPPIITNVQALLHHLILHWILMLLRMSSTASLPMNLKNLPLRCKKQHHLQIILLLLLLLLLLGATKVDLPHNLLYRWCPGDPRAMIRIEFRRQYSLLDQQQLWIGVPLRMNHCSVFTLETAASRENILSC